MRLPSAPTANATAVAGMVTRTAATALASTTRPRCGTRVNVANPERWLHSEVTDRTAMMGRMMVIGTPMARVNSL
jgi:hypothetical protein